MPTTPGLPPDSRTTTLLEALPASLPSGAPVMTALVEHPPASPGTPPHRHSGPVFGYVVEGSMVFELEGEPPRVVAEGEAFWEPGGDVVHWQDANASQDAWLRFVVVMVCPEGEPMLVPLTQDEVVDRQSRRVAAAPSST